MNEKEVSEKEIAELEVNMAQMKLKHVELCTNSDLLAIENEVSNTNMK